MNKQTLYISIGLFCAAIICFLLVPVFLMMGNYSSAKNKEACDKESEAQMKKDSTKCAAWDGAQCRKGQPIGAGLCLAKRNIKPLIFMIAGCVLLFTAIVTFIISKMSKK